MGTESIKSSLPQKIVFQESNKRKLLSATNSYTISPWMKLPTRPNSDTGQTSQEKLEEREAWYKLVVKVILWGEESANVNRNLAETANRITLPEWKKYCQRMVTTNATYSKEKVLLDLDLTLQRIKVNGGLIE